MKQFPCMLLAAFLFFTACKRGDVICIDCPKPPTCYPWVLWEEVEGGEVPSIQHFKILTTGGVISRLYPALFAPGTPREYQVYHTGNNLYMVDEQQMLDTVLAAKLDHCKRPVSSIYKDNRTYTNITSGYSYNTKGQLTKITVSGTTPDVINYTYDNRGNVLTITTVNTHRKQVFQYDYSKPVPRGTVRYSYNFIYHEIFQMAPHYFFEWMGNISLTPANLRKSSELWVDNVLTDKKTYDNYTFEDGYVKDYIGHNLLTTPNRKHFYHLLWECPSPTKK